jgi:hypothetical protein
MEMSGETKFIKRGNEMYNEIAMKKLVSKIENISSYPFVINLSEINYEPIEDIVNCFKTLLDVNSIDGYIDDQLLVINRLIIED